jgi:hypothetical protein
MAGDARAQRRLLELSKELGSSALGGAVGEVEDCGRSAGEAEGSHSHGVMESRSHGRLTLLDAVLAGLAVVVNLTCDALDALVVVVLGAVALAGVAAL